MSSYMSNQLKYTGKPKCNDYKLLDEKGGAWETRKEKTMLLEKIVRKKKAELRKKQAVLLEERTVLKSLAAPETYICMKTELLMIVIMVDHSGNPPSDGANLGSARASGWGLFQVLSELMLDTRLWENLLQENQINKMAGLRPKGTRH